MKSFVDLTSAAAAGDAAAADALRSQLGHDEANLQLIAEALHTHAPDAVAGYAEGPWAGEVDLAAQAYAVVLQDAWGWDLPVEDALLFAPFAARHRAAVGTSGPAGAAGLAQDLRAIAAQAAAFVDDMAAVRAAQAGCPGSPLELAGLRRLEKACGGSLSGVRVLELGCAEGALLDEMAARGAEVTGNDVLPQTTRHAFVAGDFLEATFPGAPFDAVLAVALFEAGSGIEHEADVTLSRLAQLVRPGGVVVVENIALPLMWTVAEAAEAGFDRMDVEVWTPVTQMQRQVAFAQGGRGAAMRKRE